MAGVKGKSGGARPGAGRKTAATKDYQTTMRAAFERCVTREEWEVCIQALLRDAKRGSVAAFRELAPWVVGRVPDQVEHRGNDGGAIQIVYAPRLAEVPKAD